MKRKNVIRAWRDEEYRRSLSEEELAMLPEHPAGFLKMEDDEVLGSVTGGCIPPTFNHCGNTSCIASCDPHLGDICI
ncbi:MAG: mersacidin/lichenicidin family type 2 lantibiotic [Acidobacteriota bacterium]